MRWRSATATLLALTAFASSAPAQQPDQEVQAPIPRGGVMKMSTPLRVVPDRVSCVLAGYFPVLRARVETPVAVEKARLRFRPAAYPLWYEVALQSSAEGDHAILPKPRLAAQSIHYYFEVTTPGARARTPELSVTVVEDASQCTGKVAPAVDNAYVSVVVPRGAPAVPPVPPGFIPAGTVSAHQGGARKSRRTESLIALGGLGALAAGMTAIPLGKASAEPPDTRPTNRPILQFLASSPPPFSTVPIGSSMMVRLLVKPDREVGPGRITVIFFRGSDGAHNPCALLSLAHDGLKEQETREMVVGGPLLGSRPCQSEWLRIVLEEGGRLVLTTGSALLRDYSLGYTFVP